MRRLFGVALAVLLSLNLIGLTPAGRDDGKCPMPGHRAANAHPGPSGSAITGLFGNRVADGSTDSSCRHCAPSLCLTHPGCAVTALTAVLLSLHGWPVEPVAIAVRVASRVRHRSEMPDILPPPPRTT
jgi:hypothetical protein